MKVTMSNGVDDGVLHFDSMLEAHDYLLAEIRDLDKVAGVYYTAASNGEESNVWRWVVFGHHDSIDYPDQVWSAYWHPRLEEWGVKRESA